MWGVEGSGGASEKRTFNSNADELDERDSCRVNATFFAILGSCNLRCVERRDDDCFMCNRECNGKYLMVMQA